MVEVVVFAEGQTEEQFIKRLVAPALRPIQVYLKLQILKASRDAKGGAISFDRLKFYARNTLRSILMRFCPLFLTSMAWRQIFPDLTRRKK